MKMFEVKSGYKVNECIKKKYCSMYIFLFQVITSVSVQKLASVVFNIKFAVILDHLHSMQENWMDPIRLC
jgi:hypothetical protein